VRMLLSFQRPSHLCGQVIPNRGRVRNRPIPERTGEYSARIAARGSRVPAGPGGVRPGLRQSRPPLPPSGG
jgi:hypothetical protein